MRITQRMIKPMLHDLTLVVKLLKRISGKEVMNTIKQMNMELALFRPLPQFSKGMKPSRLHD